MNSATRNKVYLVGAGPGDPKLITLRGKELLEKADVVIYDYLANPLLLNFANDCAERIYVGKKGGARSELHQEQINQQMIAQALAGKMVVRLKGGDPFIFGRGGEEAEALTSAKIPFEVVPGVTSAIGVPTYAGIPLTHREKGSSVAFITGHEDPTKDEQHLDWEKLATACDTLVLLMGMANLSAIITKLIEHGRKKTTPIALIQWGTYPTQKTLIGTLNTIEAQAKRTEIKPPVVMVVGEVVALRTQMNWFETLPLFGRKILITRATEQAQEFADLLTLQGAEVLYFPAIKIMPPPDFSALDEAISNVERYDTIIFTSVNGVQSFRNRLYQLGYDLRILKGISLCAIGPRTREEIIKSGLLCDFIPSEFRAEGILEELEKRGIAGKRFLLPRALEAREILPAEIKNKGGRLDVVAGYQTISPSETDREEIFRKGPIDMITFASASTVRNFVEGMTSQQMAFLKESAIACIGPITAQAARSHNMQVDLISNEYTFPALTEAIVEYFKRK
jgi:uroporphyrinogen III methyltransferase/synthase